MGRIRSIKPEFPHSESMGAVSRDARLLFIMLFTLADDSGRLRGNSRMLASLLFPYDSDAPSLIDSWLQELVKQEVIVVYFIEGSTFIQIAKWLIHQKIDKPSPSKIPPFDEHSENIQRMLFDDSTTDRIKDQGSRIKDWIIKEPIGSLSASKLPDCPHKEILNLWEKHLPHLTQPRLWNGPRSDLLRARWAEASKKSEWSTEGYLDVPGGIKFWDSFFCYIAKETTLSKGFETNGRIWTPTLEWVLKSSNFAKIIDGKYEIRKRS